MASWQKIGGTLLVLFIAINGFVSAGPYGSSAELFGVAAGVLAVAGGLIYWIWTHDNDRETRYRCEDCGRVHSFSPQECKECGSTDITEHKISKNTN